MALTQAQRARLLEGVELFSAAGSGGCAAIGERAVEVEFTAGQRIARQGEVETGFFMIVSGRVSIVRDGEVLAHLGPGEFFGELSLIDQQPRIASVTADEATTCLAVPSWEFGNLLQARPELALAVLKAVVRRLRALPSERHD
jgi:CRP/FNR family transcriptional regulator, cyclic AMP receptor protein